MIATLQLQKVYIIADNETVATIREIRHLGGQLFCMTYSTLFDDKSAKASQSILAG